MVNQSISLFGTFPKGSLSRQVASKIHMPKQGQNLTQPNSGVTPKRVRVFHKTPRVSQVSLALDSVLACAFCWRLDG